MEMVVSYIAGIQKQLGLFTGWPMWALLTVEILVSLNAIVALFDMIQPQTPTIDTPTPEKHNTDSDSSKITAAKSFRSLQFSYLSVYFIVMLADWLQGTHMYTLYTSYGVDVGVLFLTGFLSSAVLGTFLGVFVDSWGRRWGCIVFCVLEIVINLLEHIPHLGVLLLGRVLGGLSTCLLFSAFESWLVCEHRRQGFSEASLTHTFSLCSWGNGLCAIVAGFVSQFASDSRGNIGPFQVAIVLTILALGLIVSLWDENYVDNKQETLTDNGKKLAESQKQQQQQQHQPTLMETLTHTMTHIRNDPRVLLLGLSQAAFEGAVYSFVFMWVPSLLSTYGSVQENGEALPTGLIFSSFMLAMTLGGGLFNILHRFLEMRNHEKTSSQSPSQSTAGQSFSVYYINVIVFAVSGVSMCVPLWYFEFWPILISFFVLECMLGVFNSCGATLRACIYPQHLQSTIMNLFRVPLNLLVVIGTRLANDSNPQALQQTFKYLQALHFVAMLLQIALLIVTQLRAEVTHRHREQEHAPNEKYKNE